MIPRDIALFFKIGESIFQQGNNNLEFKVLVKSVRFVHHI